jgi:uncharacterized protein (DUF427 family)
MDHKNSGERTMKAIWNGAIIAESDATEIVEGNQSSYADPKPEAAQIKNHVAFWKGVEVST